GRTGDLRPRGPGRGAARTRAFGAPAPRRVQRAAARGVRALRVGPRGRAPPRPGGGARPDRDRRYPLARARRARPHGLGPGSRVFSWQHTPGPRPVRIAARAVRGSELLRQPALLDVADA